MSVIVIGHMTVEPGRVEKLWDERKADFETIAREARAAGALRHEWGFGSDYVVIIDEWPDAASFQSFFDSQPLIAQLMQEAGVKGPPTFEVLESKAAPDQF